MNDESEYKTTMCGLAIARAGQIQQRFGVRMRVSPAKHAPQPRWEVLVWSDTLAPVIDEARTPMGALDLMEKRLSGRRGS
jgi:hypothetical protein